MSLPFSLFMALKYMKPRRTFLSVISILSVTGVLLGVAVLIIVLSVMSGFDCMWRDKILGFDAHITVMRPGIIEDEDKLVEQITRVNGVTGVAPCVQGLVFIQHNNVIYTPVMRGIDVKAEKETSQLPRHMIAGEFTLEDDQVIIGSELAMRMGVRLGDKLLIYSPQNFIGADDEISLPEEMEIAGIFNIGMWEYDIGYILVPLAVARELYGIENGVHMIRVMTKDPFRAYMVADRIRKTLDVVYPDIRVQTWMQLNHRLFDALKVEKNMMLFLLIFIVLVAAFGITNTLIIVVVQKTKEIGVLKALGFSSGSIMCVFLWQSWIQGLIGIILGTGLGLVVLRFRNNIMSWLSACMNMELLPKELYHISQIPSRTSPVDVTVICVLSMLICTLAGLLPAWRAARLDPAQALRYE